jgi:glutamate racemase
MEQAHCQRRVQRHQSDHGLNLTRPVGVFDSGVGGLSVLRALRAELPHQPLIYVADSGHAPYGERDPAHTIQRSLAITDYLVTQHHIQTLVVACNTATAAAIHLLRNRYPDLPLVGVEPALKPAAQLSTTRRVGVLATRNTLQSQKFKALHDRLQTQVEFVCIPCDGLADAIERNDAARIEELSARHIAAMGPLGTEHGQIDTVVLGCTHYPLILPVLADLTKRKVTFIESGAPVARQTHRVLPQEAPQVPSTSAALASAEATDAQNNSAPVFWYTTGVAGELQEAVKRWVMPQAHVQRLNV